MLRVLLSAKEAVDLKKRKKKWKERRNKLLAYSRLQQLKAGVPDFVESVSATGIARMLLRITLRGVEHSIE